MKIALDATYSVGENLSGVGVYSRELLRGLATAHPEERFEFCYRPHRYLRSFRAALPRNARRALLYEPLFPRARDFFHGLNQRLPEIRFRKTVSTFHDLFVLTGDYSTPDFRRRFAEQARRAAAESDAIIAVSDFTARQVKELLGWSRPACTWCIMARTGWAVAGVREARKHRAQRGRDPTAQKYLAPGGGIRAHATGVEAGACGIGGPRRRRNLWRASNRARAAGISRCWVISRVTCWRRWYGRARVFAFPSLDEGFGMPVLEAMAAGVPVLAANRAALPEVCGDAALLVDPEDVEAIAVGLNRLMGDEALAEQLIARGLDRVSGIQLAKSGGTNLERVSRIADLADEGCYFASSSTAILSARKKRWSWLVNLIFPVDSKVCFTSAGVPSCCIFSRIAVFVALVKTDSGLEHQEHVVTSLLDLADCFGDAIGVRQRIVNRVPQFLH